MKRRHTGFTLIEVIIVLSIAAMIMTGVILAAQGAQRNARDTTRRKDVNKLSTAIEQYSANKNGTLPGDGTLALAALASNNPSTPGALYAENYLDINKFKDPKTTNTYALYKGPAPAQAEKNNGTLNCPLGNMYYQLDSTSNSYKLQACLESGVYNFTP